MAAKTVRFRYIPGVIRPAFTNARLTGSWDASGRFSNQWSTATMTPIIAEDGCPAFAATVDFPDDQVGQQFFWGVILDAPVGSNQWGITTEVKHRASTDRVRSFTLEGGAGVQEQDYLLSTSRWLGAQKHLPNVGGAPRMRFSVWAPNATDVKVVIGKISDSADATHAPLTMPISLDKIAGGYVSNNGDGAHPSLGPFQMSKGQDGVWTTDVNDAQLANYATFDHVPYMFRVVKNSGATAFRTDLYSRCQIGYGGTNPNLNSGEYVGLLKDLDGGVSCSVVINPDTVTKYFEEPVFPELEFVSAEEFWADEFVDGLRPPSRVEDLITYELHLGALGFGHPGSGTLQDAIDHLDYLVDLGVTAIELLPLSEFQGGGQGWGYATSHHFAIEYSGGGRDQFKHFVKACHRRGLAVIIDVVYNHFAHDAERAESRYDSDWPDYDIYFWYEGVPFDYPRPDGGYVENQSTAPAPRYHEEMVRKMFISSAVALMEEFHIDGFRVDQTTSIHAYNRLRADQRVEVSAANIFGAKLLREFGRTLRLIRPSVILMAEDHSDWDQLTKPVEQGGMGFDARWYAEYYHHLIGDTKRGADTSKLIYMAALLGSHAPLAVGKFATQLYNSKYQKVVYNESHDEAGNSGGGPFFDSHWDPSDQGKQYTSHRTIVVASNAAPLVGPTRQYAEARCRFAYGVTVLSAGTPMFLFGEEVGARNRFKYKYVVESREDLHGMRAGDGARLFHFYAEINRLRRKYATLRSRSIDILEVNDANRVLLFRRTDAQGDFLVAASVNDDSFDHGYLFRSGLLPDASWHEIFNSNATEFGGDNLGNSGGVRQSHNSEFECVLPRNSVVVFQRVS